MKNDIRTLIASKRFDARDRLRRFLATEPGLTVIGEVSDMSSISQMVAQTKPDILFVDFAMTQESQSFATSSLPFPIVVKVIPIQNANREAFLMDAHGIVLATATPKLLIESIRNLMAGHHGFEHKSMGVLMDALREVFGRREEPPPAKDYRLTPRELDIIEKIVNGRSNKEVGVEFAISERTVKHHLTNIFGKVGVSSRLQLALFAVSHHLTSSQARALAMESMQTEPARMNVRRADGAGNRVDVKA